MIVFVEDRLASRTGWELIWPLYLYETLSRFGGRDGIRNLLPLASVLRGRVPVVEVESSRHLYANSEKEDRWGCDPLRAKVATLIWRRVGVFDDIDDDDDDSDNDEMARSLPLLG